MSCGCVKRGPGWSRGRLAGWGVIGVGLILLSLVMGCANSELNYNRSMAVLSAATSGAWKSLNRYDLEKMDELRGKAEDDAAAAYLEYLDYKKKYDLARKVLATLTDALDVTDKGGALYKAVAAKDWGGALQQLLQIGFALRDVMKVFNIEVPF